MPNEDYRRTVELYRVALRAMVEFIPLPQVARLGTVEAIERRFNAALTRLQEQGELPPRPSFAARVHLDGSQLDVELVDACCP